MTPALSDSVDTSMAKRFAGAVQGRPQGVPAGAQHGKAGKLLVLGGDNIPRRICRAGAQKHLFLLSSLILRGWEERYGAHI